MKLILPCPPTTDHRHLKPSIDLGYGKEDFTTFSTPATSISPPNAFPAIAQIHLLTSLAILPTLRSPDVVGFDAYSTLATVLEPNKFTAIPLDIAIVPPTGTFIQILPYPGLAQHGITIHAGTIAPIFTGNITVLLYNISLPIPAHPGDRITQMVFQCYDNPGLQHVCFSPPQPPPPNHPDHLGKTSTPTLC